MGLSDRDVALLTRLFPDKVPVRDLLREVLNERGVLSQVGRNTKEADISQALATPLTKLCARSVANNCMLWHGKS